MVWIGWVFSAIPILMMGVLPIVYMTAKHDEAVERMTHYGYGSNQVIPLCLLEVGCAIIYAIPQTAVLGAILLTGYLGGAVATHVRAGELPMALGPVVFGVFVWLGLYLREARLRKLVPLR